VSINAVVLRLVLFCGSVGAERSTIPAGGTLIRVEKEV
jgi:hypothetical protein